MKTHRVELRITDEEKEAWTVAAKAAGLSLSEWLRRSAGEAMAAKRDPIGLPLPQKDYQEPIGIQGCKSTGISMVPPEPAQEPTAADIEQDAKDEATFSRILGPRPTPVDRPSLDAPIYRWVCKLGRCGPAGGTVNFSDNCRVCGGKRS